MLISTRYSMRINVGLLFVPLQEKRKHKWNILICPVLHSFFSMPFYEIDEQFIEKHRSIVLLSDLLAVVRFLNTSLTFSMCMFFWFVRKKWQKIIAKQKKCVGRNKQQKQEQ